MQLIIILELARKPEDWLRIPKTLRKITIPIILLEGDVEQDHLRKLLDEFLFPSVHLCTLMIWEDLAYFMMPQKIFRFCSINSGGVAEAQL